MERFFLEVQLPPPITYFDFDLQRFVTTTVDSADDLSTAITNATAGDTIKLGDSFTGSLTETLTIDKKLTLDLNGQTLTTSAAVGIQVNNSIEFTLNDSQTGGKIKNTHDTFNRDDNSGVVRVGQPSANDSTATNATFNMNGGTIEAGKVIGINIIGVSTANVVYGCSVTSDDSCAVYFGVANCTYTEGKNDQSTNLTADDVTYGTSGGGTLNMTGGTLQSAGKATISTNGCHIGETKINVSGGTVKNTGTSNAIYASAVKELNISGNAVIEAQKVGIEIREGTLNVSGNATIKGNQGSTGGITYKPSTDGATTDDGVAIVAAQHDTQRNITVNIEGGNISGYSALLVNNANNNPDFDSENFKLYGNNNHDHGKFLGELVDGKRVVGKIAVNVTGGTFTSTGSDEGKVTQGSATGEYTIKGKNAIINLDKRVIANLSNAKVEGTVAAITTGRAEGDTGYNIGTSNDFTSFTVAEDGDGTFITYNSISDDNVTLTLATLGLSGAFNRPDKDATEWRYLAGENQTVAAIDPDATGSTKLALTIGEGLNPSLATAAEVDFTSDLFGKYNTATTFDGSKAPASFPLNITGNDKIASIAAGAGNDTLTPGDVPSITLTGGAGNDLFVFNGGSEKITDFGDGTNSLGTDSISMPSSFRPANADFAAEDGKISLDFGGDVLMFDELGDREVSLSGGHIFATRYHAIDKQSITFTTVQSGDYDASSTEYETIDAALAGASIAITGNDKDNRIIGSNKGGTLNGGEGNDKIFVTERDTNAKYLFEHTAGKDVVDGFDDANDTLSVELTNTTEAKGSSSKLTLTFGKNDNIALKSDAGIEKVILPDNRYLTDSGYFGSNEFKLFQNAKGKIDFTDAPYKGTGIQTIDATNSKKKSVTLTADANVTTVKLADNKKKDQFNYGGGTVSITGYESGKDKLNIADVGAVSLFSVDENGVSINAGGTDVISIQGAKDKEVLILDGGKGSSYSKFVFHDTGVLYNKAKRATEAKIYSNAGNYIADSSVKKIFLQEGVAGISVTSGNNKTTLDASAANGVSLIGGAKNNRFVGSDYGDMFVYKGGKDAVTNFQVGGEVGDSISFDTGTYKIEDAKISLGKKSLKFKFSGKNALDLKSDGAVSSLSFGNQSYTFAKNAFSTTTGTASLTSAFSGSYNLAKNEAYSTVDGSLSKKNLTFKGTDGDEVLTGGTKKTNFKGGGGDDTLTGGSGKDIFFYAKGDSGTSTIANFDFGTDKLKIANGTIQTITKAEDSITFEMSSGGKNGSFQLTSYYDSTNKQQAKLDTTATKNVAFKVNNTHYWFAQSDVKDGNTTLAKEGQLITWDKKVTARDVAGLNVIDLGYSTNLAKAELAVKVSSTATGATLPSSSGSNSN